MQIKNTKRSGIICVIVILVFVVVAVLIFVLGRFGHKNSQPDVVEVTNYNELDIALPQTTRENLSGQLYYLLSKNFEVPEISRSVKAVIRPDTLEHSEEYNTTTASFVLDVDEYKQTFWISVSWSDSVELPNDVAIECVTNNLAKYSGQECYGMTTTSDSVEIYLPHTGTLSDGKEYTVGKKYGLGDREILEIDFNNCGDAGLIREAISEVKGWLEENGFDPDNFEYEVPTRYKKCLIKGN